MSDNNLTIKSDKAAYSLLNQFKDDIVNAIDTAMTEAKDDEEREILVGLICGTARHSHDNHRPKAIEKAKSAERRTLYVDDVASESQHSLTAAAPEKLCWTSDHQESAGEIKLPVPHPFACATRDRTVSEASLLER